MINQITGGLRTSAIALALIALLVPGCQQTNEVGQGEETNVTTEEIAENAESFIGQMVTIRGDVEKRNDFPTSFLLQDEEVFGNEQVLVINSAGYPFVMPEGSDIQVQVTGQVRDFIIADIEREFGLDLDPNLYAEFEQEPVVIAQSLALAPQPEQIAENPSFFYGQQIAVKGEVDEIVSPNAFKLDEENLLVLNPQLGETVEDGESVVMTGEVRPFVLAELERDYNLTWDLDMQRQLEAEYSNQPVFIADGIYPSAE